MTTPLTLECLPLEERGSIEIIGSGMPTGSKYTLQRQQFAYSPWEDLRGGGGDITTGGFIREDTEPPFGTPVNYKVELTIPTASRHIQTNHVQTPSFPGGTLPVTVAPGAGRTMTQVLDALNGGRIVGLVSANTNGINQGVAGRTIADFQATGLLPGAYQITGEIRYEAEDVSRWIDVRDQNADWAALLTKTWATVRSEGGETAYSGLYVAISVGTTDYVAPILVRKPTTGDMGTWLRFSVRLTLPANIPTTAKVRLLHGTQVREYAATWRLDKFSMMPLSEVGPQYFYWFDGRTPVPADPAQNLFPGTNFEPLSTDSVIKWDGPGYASTSTYLGPSKLVAIVTCQINGPVEGDNSNPVFACDPVFLNDPVLPRLGQWFGLIRIDTANWAARRDIYSIIQRSSQLAVNDLRHWESATMTVLTSTLEQRKMAIDLFASGRILQFRNPDLRMPEGNDGGPWYISIGDITEERPFADHRRPERYWHLPYVRVERPKGLIDSSDLGNSWQTVKDTGKTWGQLKTSHANWLGVITDDTGGGTLIVGSPADGSGLLPTQAAHQAWEDQTLPVTV